MRPSLVRSKRAPHSSSSSTRSGASWAWSWAMRQLLSILPPRMVSRKWTCQLSSDHTLPMEAAMPPSAMTVWALPRSDLQMTAVLAPWAWASMAARRPAPPAPTTITSKSWVSRSAMSEEPRVVDGAAGHQPDVDVGQADEDEAHPGQAHVVLVEQADPLPHPVAGRPLGHGVEMAPAQMATGVAGEEVRPQQNGVDEQDEGAEAQTPAGHQSAGARGGEHAGALPCLPQQD